MRQKVSFAAVLLMLVMPNISRAYDFSAIAPSGQTLYYNFLPGGNVEVTSQYQSSEYYHPSTSPAGALEIPASVIFYGVTHPVTSIGSHAFKNCGGLTSVAIPNTVTSICSDAFFGCSDMTSVTIGDSATIIGNNAFRNCSGLTSIIIPSSVTSIGQYAFYGCNISSLSIPNNVTSIGLHAFYHIRHIEYYGSATGSPWSSFSMNGVTEGDFVFSSPIKDTLTAYLGNGDGIVIPNTVISIGNGSFYNCDSLTSVTIPNSVVSIGDYAFFSCNNLTSILIPNAITSIGNFSFNGCSGLTSLVIPDSVILIGEQAFGNCHGLISVTIGRSVTSIGQVAFRNCSSLTTVYFNAINCTSMPGISSYNNNQIFYLCNNLTTLYIGDNVINIPTGAFYKCGSLTSVTIGDSVTSIGSFAFQNCNGLTSVTIPSSVTLIGYSAFYNCSGLTEITSLASVAPTLQIYAFDGVNSAIPINIPCGSLGSYSPSWTCFSVFNELAEFTIDCSTADTIQGTIQLLTVPTCDSSVAVIRATPSYGYHFSQWNDGDTSNPRTITLTSDTSFTAQFDRNQYNVTGVANNSARGVVMGSDTVYYLDTVTLEAIANYGYYFYHWNDNNTMNPRQIVATGNITKTAIFNPNQYSIILSVDTSIHGSCSGGGNYNYLSNRTITANANYGYHFTQWNDGNTQNPRTITLTQDTAFMAHFAKNQYTVNVFASHADRGSVTGGGTVDYFDTVTLTATANYGYHFTQWSDGNTDNPRQVQVTHDSLFTAQFDYNQYSITLVVDTTIYGTVSGAGSYNYLSTRTITATPNYGYHFTQWSDGDTNNPRTLILTQDTMFTASFAPNLYNLTAVSADETMGTVSGGGTYDYGNAITVTANPVEHHHFLRWNDGNTDNPRTVVIEGDRTLTAFFAIDTHTVSVTVNDISRGMVEANGTEFVYGTPCTVTATAYSGYVFSHWSNDVTYNPYTFAVMEDVELTAIFVEEGTQGISDIGGINGLRVYTKGGSIHINGIEGQHVSVYSVDGRIITTKNNATEQESIPVPSTGVYFIKVGEYPARRVVVVR